MATCRLCGEKYNIKFHVEYFAHHREDYDRAKPPPCVDALRTRLQEARELLDSASRFLPASELQMGIRKWLAEDGNDAGAPVSPADLEE